MFGVKIIPHLINLKVIEVVDKNDVDKRLDFFKKHDVLIQGYENRWHYTYFSWRGTGVQSKDYPSIESAIAAGLKFLSNSCKFIEK